MPKPAKRHPVRTFAAVVVAVGVALALRNAVADKGGSYDPANPERP